MGHKSGKEIRSLVLAVSATTLILVLAIIAYFMVDVIITTNNNIKHNEDLVIEQSVLSLTQVGENLSDLTQSPAIIGIFNQDLIDKILAGDWNTFYKFIGDFAIPFYPIEYVSIIQNGEIMSYDTRGLLVVDPEEMPTEPPEGDYETLDRLGDKEGLFISVFYPVDLGLRGLDQFYVNMIVDRTDEMAAVSSYFESQRNDLILRLSIVSIIAILLSLLLTTLGLRHFTRKYVVKPIEDLNIMAEEIASGTFEGDVEVDESSAFAALQGLLRSGQKVLKKMDEEIQE
jgi:hypothetical protein